MLHRVFLCVVFIRAGYSVKFSSPSSDLHQGLQMVCRVILVIVRIADEGIVFAHVQADQLESDLFFGECFDTFFREFLECDVVPVFGADHRCLVIAEGYEWHDREHVDFLLPFPWVVDGELVVGVLFIGTFTAGEQCSECHG